MKNRLLNKFSVLVAFMLVVLGTTASAQSVGSVNHNRSFEGTWDSSINFFGVFYRALYSFHQGGTVSESDNPAVDPTFGGDALSPGLGAWEYAAPNKIKVKYRKLAYDATGALHLVYTSSMSLVMATNSNTWSGTLNIVITSPDGSVINKLTDLPVQAFKLSVE